MRKTFRLGLLASGCACALAFAAPALASFSPKLFVTHAAGVTIKVQVANTDDPTAKVTIYAPTGYQLKDPPPVGSSLGMITATASAADLGGAILPLTGDLIAADPAQFVGAPNNTCVPGQHAQVWILNLTAAGQTLQIPMYVDPTSGAAAAFASFTIVTCLPPPDVPAGTPGRATFGAKLLSAEFGTTAVTPAAAGGVWHSIWTPWTPQKGQVNVAGTVEAQAKAGGSPTLSLSAKKVAKGKARLTAKLSPATAGASVVFTVAGRKVGAKTSAAGTASVTVAVKKATTASATATAAAVDLGSAGCSTTVPGSPFPCVDATASALKVGSKAVRVEP